MLNTLIMSLNVYLYIINQTINQRASLSTNQSTSSPSASPFNVFCWKEITLIETSVALNGNRKKSQSIHWLKKFSKHSVQGNLQYTHCYIYIKKKASLHRPARTSNMKVEELVCISSSLPTREKIWLAILKDAYSAGTKLPVCAIICRSATCLR